MQDSPAILTRDQAGLLLQSTEDQKHRMLFMLAIFTGARQGELLGLKWEDIDWQAGQVHFQRTFNNGPFFSPKTGKSNRKVTIGSVVLTKLKKWKLHTRPSDWMVEIPLQRCQKTWDTPGRP